MNKLLTTILLLSFSLVSYGATQGVSFNSTTKNVNQTDLKQGFTTITNAAATASEIAGYDANKKLGSFSAAATRALLSVPVFDLADPGAVNIFPFWDDTGNEVDWTSNTALLTLLGIDSNDAVTFGTVTATTVTATTLVGAAGGATYNGAGNNGNLATSINTLQELNDAVDNLSLGGGGSAPTGTMVSSGTAPVIYALYAAADTTGTNFIATGLYTDSTLTNLYFGGMFVGSMTLTNALGVASGGTGLSSGTSGGVLYYSASGTLASSGVLSANAVVLGGGAGVAPSTTTTASGFVTWMGTPSSANFFTLITGETGSGAVVGGTGPTISAPIFTGNITLGSTAGTATLTAGQMNLNTTDKQIGIHNGTKEVAIPLTYSKEISFDPKGVCDGAVDRLFLFTVGSWAPKGITITRWRLSFEADPATEADIDLKRATAVIGVGSAAVMDVLDTTAGVSTETTAANINSGAVVANGQVVYLEFGTAYTETTHQMFFELEYEIEED